MARGSGQGRSTGAGNPPSDITLSGLALDENAAAGTIIATLGTEDQDAGSTFTYALVTGNGTNDADNNLVTIVGNRIEVKSGAVVDYETNPFLNLNVRVTDNSGLSYTKALTVPVNNLWELFAEVGRALSDRTRNLNSAAVPEFVRSLATTVGRVLNETRSYGTSSVNNVTAALGTGFAAAGEIASGRVTVAGDGIRRGFDAIVEQAEGLCSLSRWLIPKLKKRSETGEEPLLYSLLHRSTQAGISTGAFRRGAISSLTWLGPSPLRLDASACAICWPKPGRLSVVRPQFRRRPCIEPK